jgi:hypothetical protein
MDETNQMSLYQLSTQGGFFGNIGKNPFAHAKTEF